MMRKELCPGTSEAGDSSFYSDRLFAIYGLSRKPLPRFDLDTELADMIFHARLHIPLFQQLRFGPWPQ